MPFQREWITRGKKDGYRYLLVICDTWDYTDYPVFYKTIEEVREHYSRNGQNMERIEESYDLEGDIQKQIDTYRTHVSLK